MARQPTSYPPTTASVKPMLSSTSRRISSKNAAERSAYFARREAAKVLRRVLHGDATRQATASIKSLVYSPSVRNKKATFALVCQTLKYLPILKDVLSASNILNSKWKKQEELIYVALYDTLFGKEITVSGDAEKFLAVRKSALQAALAHICTVKKVNHAKDLLKTSSDAVTCGHRYVRVNTLKMDVESAMRELEKTSLVSLDEIVPDLIVLPSGVDLHNHPLVLDGSVFLQGKASSMVAVALSPEPGWKVLDACAAPGNKTVHLAALMKGKGNVIACEHHEQRIKILKDTIRRSGAPNIDAIHQDFLDISTEDPKFKGVNAILLDPSCSGSGISAKRLDFLLPSYSKGKHTDDYDTERVRKLAAFQKKALLHALSFPAVERVVYSTCSVHQAENEDVVKSVLPFATSLNFKLETPFPDWPCRGLPVFEGADHLLRTNPSEDTEGFFIALFVKQQSLGKSEPPRKERCVSIRKRKLMKTNRQRGLPFSRMFLVWSYSQMSRRRTSKKRTQQMEIDRLT